MKKIIFLIFLFSLLSIGSEAWATTIFSPIVELEIEPGESQRGIVKIYNETEEDLYLTSSVEQFSSEDETGQPVYLPPSEQGSFLKWFTVEEDAIIVKPRQVVIVPFTVTVPKEAVPGGYYGVIFWQTTPRGPEGGSGVSVSTKVGTLVFLKVKGEVIEKGEVAEFSTLPSKKYFWQLPVNFLVRFANIGNVHLRPSGKIELENWLGQVEALEINAGQRYVLPDSIRRFETVLGQSIPGDKFWQNFWPKLKEELDHPFPGKYTITLSLNFGIDSQQEVKEQLSFWFIPWRLIVVLIFIIILLIIFILINSKMKKLKKQIEMAPKVAFVMKQSDFERKK